MRQLLSNAKIYPEGQIEDIEKNDLVLSPDNYQKRSRGFGLCNVKCTRGVIWRMETTRKAVKKRKALQHGKKKKMGHNDHN